MLDWAAMTVACPHCHATYGVPTESIPTRGLRVRCPRCHAVFPVRREDAAVETVAAARRAARAEGPPDPFPSLADEEEEIEVEDEDPPMEPEVSVRSPRLITDASVARRMARAMVQEMVLPREPEKRAGLEDGTVLRRFGADIARAHSLYAARLHPDLPQANEIFRQAVNDVLGDGTNLL